MKSNKKLSSQNVKSKDRIKKGDIMTTGTMEKVYKEQAEGMRKYLSDLRRMSPQEAKKIATHNLKNAGIMGDDGKLSERYSYSRNRKK